MALRSIFTRGEPFPNVALKRTLKLHTQYQEGAREGGFDRTPHPHQRFPWLHPTRSSISDPNGLLLNQQTSTGYRDVQVLASPYDRQLYINNEDSHILTFEQCDELGLDPLVYNTPENATEITARRMPDSLKDTVLNSMETYPIVASDSAARTITIRGLNWYANRNADSGRYGHDAYIGINEYMRDRLDTDAVVHYSRNKQYPFIHVRVAGVKLKIDKIDDVVTDNIVTSRDLGLIVGGLPEGSTVNVEIRQIDDTGKYSSALTGTHTLTGAPGATTNKTHTAEVTGSGSTIGAPPPARGGPEELIAPSDLRIYSVSASVCNIIFTKSTKNTFYELTVNGIVVAHLFSSDGAPTPNLSHFSGLDHKAQSLHVLRYQGTGEFPAPALINPSDEVNYGSLSMMRRPQWISSMIAWTGTFHQRYGVYRLRLRVSKHMLQFISAFLWGGYSQVDGVRQNKAGKENEQDIFEFPGGTYLFHNMWKPTGGMYNYAEVNGEKPVMDHPEWTEDTNIQHQILIRDDHEHYVDPQVEMDMLYAMWPPGNEATKDGFTNEVYTRTADGEYRFTCGAVTSSASRGDNPLTKLVSFLCCPVDGNFVAGMEFFASGSADPENGDEIKMTVLDFEAYQFVGEEAGGASLPTQSDGEYPQPMLPTPGVSPQESGTGIVTEGVYGLFNRDTVAGVDGYAVAIATGGTGTGGTGTGETGGGTTTPTPDVVGTRISKTDSKNDIVLSSGAVNKNAGEPAYDGVLARPDGGLIRIRRARLEP